MVGLRCVLIGLSGLVFCRSAAQDRQSELQSIHDSAWRYVTTDPEKSREFARELIREAKSENSVLFEARGENDLGVTYFVEGNLSKALSHFLISHEIAIKEPPSEMLVVTLSNLGNLYLAIGDTLNAQNYLKEGLLFSSEIKNVQKLFSTSTMLGLLYLEQHQMDLAKRELKRSDSLYPFSRSESDNAYYNFFKGNFLYRSGRRKQAFTIFRTVLNQYKLLNDPIGIANSTSYIGRIHLENDRIDSAIAYCQWGYNEADAFDLIVWQEENCKCLVNAYKRKGDLENAFKYQSFLLRIDSVSHSEGVERSMIRGAIEFDYEKKRLADSLKTESMHKALLLDQEIERSRQNSVIRLLTISSVLILIIAFISFRGYLRKRKSNVLIRDQKNQVEAQKEEILSSIVYARRIQSALMPTEERRKKLLGRHFVLYQPKDIVAGDFYWLEELDDLILFGVGDCTGHGVPGALVSVICTNALNRAVREKGLKDPGLILDKVTDMVIEQFEISDQQVTDGMDMALCALEKDRRTLHFAGAFSSIFLLRGGEMLYFRGDKQPVGKYVNRENFETQTIRLEPGDKIYASSDGFPDQFGGNSGKKLKIKGFKEFVLAVQNLPIEDQGVALNAFFENWRGDFEQIDDVCVLGIQIDQSN